MELYVLACGKDILYVLYISVKKQQLFERMLPLSKEGLGGVMNEYVNMKTRIQLFEHEEYNHSLALERS